MNNNLIVKIQKFIPFVLIASILVGISYLLVFNVSFLPNGYEIVEVQSDSISLKSFNVIGMENNTSTVTFSEDDTWKINAIEREVKRQKEFLWLLYSAFTISLFLLIYKARNGMKVWKAILDSNIIFAVLIPITPIYYSLDRIQNLIS